MGALLSYSFVSGLFMLSMFLAYRVFLARENQPGFNRSILLLIYVISFLALPLASFAEKIMSVSHGGPIEIANVEIANSDIISGSTSVWGVALIWIFIVGMFCVAFKTIFTWKRLIKVIRNGEKIKHDGYTLVIVDSENLAPFSWIKYVIISRSDYETENHSIAIHELKHIFCRHWMDLLLAQVVCIINWFNPAAWLMRDELMLVHEYQADKAVIDSGCDATYYQTILIKKAAGTRFPSLANSLNHSKLKKRITMMYKEKSCAGSKFKVLTLLPMLALAIGVAAVPSVRAAVSTISSSRLSVSKVTQNPDSDKWGVAVFKVTNINNNGNVTTVTIAGEGLGDYLTVSGGTFTTMGKTYNARGLNCTLQNGVASIIATFPFIDEFENSSMTLLVNGEEIPFNLEGFFNNSQTVATGSGDNNVSADGVVVAGSQSSLSDGMEIYLDGKKITKTQLHALSPDQIESIDVMRQENKINITLKK